AAYIPFPVKQDAPAACRPGIQCHDIFLHMYPSSFRVLLNASALRYSELTAYDIGLQTSIHSFAQAYCSSSPSVLAIRAGSTPTACAASSTVALETGNSRISLAILFFLK